MAKYGVWCHDHPVGWMRRQDGSCWDSDDAMEAERMAEATERHYGWSRRGTAEVLVLEGDTAETILAQASNAIEGDS